MGGCIVVVYGFEVECKLLGLFGGDLQIGVEFVDGCVDIVVFLCDLMIVQLYDFDIIVLVCVCDVYDVLVVINVVIVWMLFDDLVWNMQDVCQVWVVFVF